MCQRGRHGRGDEEEMSVSGAFIFSSLLCGLLTSWVRGSIRESIKQGLVLSMDFCSNVCVSGWYFLEALQRITHTSGDII